MIPEDAKLIERLRWGYYMDDGSTHTNSIMEEAADRLAVLSEENERLRVQLREKMR